MKSMIAIEPQVSSEKHMHLCWMVHNLCDFNCSYCGPYHNAGNHRGPKSEDIFRFLRNFVSATKDYDLVHVSFSGGEPTLWKPFKDVVGYLSENGIEVGLTSNGQRPVQFWNDVIDKINWLCLSFHPEQADPKKFREVILALEHRTSLNIRVMMSPHSKSWEKSLNFWNELQTLDLKWGLFIEMVPIEENFGASTGLVKYSPDQLKILGTENPRHVKLPLGTSPSNRKHVWRMVERYNDGTQRILNQPQLVFNNQNSFKKWICHAGVESLFIKETGDIWRASCQSGGKVGNVADQVFQLPANAITCPQAKCFCGTDIAIKKYQPVQRSLWRLLPAWI